MVFKRIQFVLGYILILVFISCNNSSSYETNTQDNKYSKNNLPDTVIYKGIIEDFPIVGNRFYPKEKDTNVLRSKLNDTLLLGLNNSDTLYYFFLNNDYLFGDFLEDRMTDFFNNQLEAYKQKKEVKYHKYDYAPFTTDIFLEGDTIIWFERENRVRTVDYIYMQDNKISLEPYFKIGLSYQKILKKIGIRDTLINPHSEFKIILDDKFAITKTEEFGGYEYCLVFKNDTLAYMYATHYAMIYYMSKNNKSIKYDMYNEH